MLPLIERATEHHPLFRLVASTAVASPAALALAPSTQLIPERKPEAGEQYRFHFDASKCIGCHCCEVACSEQNNLPAELHWRRVGEMEGGSYPFTQRLHLSMGCNHCLEPACLLGCPVEAYTKPAPTGLVLHDPDVCIGCQYCVWNCPYGVPQFNPERGTVGKCDMCHGRLADGQAPACVQACPEEAIRIEIVNVAQWRAGYSSADAPGLPSADATISTTRVTLPESLPVMRKADYERIQPEDPHWPLVFMTVLTQFSVGDFLAQWIDSARSATPPGILATLLALCTGCLALGVSTAHLGRPIHAYRALKMWRRSWLSREVLFFSLFAGAATGYAGLIWLGVAGSALAGLLTVALGFAGILASACIYLVPARPAWKMAHTPIEFLLTAILLGGFGQRGTSWKWIVIGAAVLQGANLAAKVWRLRRSTEFENHASAVLLTQHLASVVNARILLLLAACVALLLSGNGLVGLPFALAGEIAGRYLFFVSVTPRNIASVFLGANGGHR